MPSETLRPDSTLAAVRLITNQVDEQYADEILAATIELLLPFGGLASIEAKPYWKSPGTHEIKVSVRVHPEFVEQPERIFQALGSPWIYDSERRYAGVWNAGDAAQLFVSNISFVWLALFDESDLPSALNQ